MATRADFNAGELQALAERFSPNLVLFPEYDSREPDNTYNRRDYHPRDIRLVLAGAAQVMVPLDFAPLQFLNAVSRTFPQVSLITGGVIIGLLLHAVPPFWTPEGSEAVRDFVLGMAVVMLTALICMGTTDGFLRLRGIWSVSFAVSVLAPIWILTRHVHYNWGSFDRMFPLIWHYGFGVLALAGTFLRLFAIHQIVPRLYSLVRQNPRLAFAGRFSLMNRIGSGGRSTALRFAEVGSPADATSHRLRYVELLRTRRDAYPLTAYANISFGTGDYDGIVAVQYWLAYFYNDWNNKHEMDWEQVTVYLLLGGGVANGDVPWSAEVLAAGLSAHLGGLLVEAEDVLSDTHPLVYVAHGSHANYHRGGLQRPGVTFGGLTFTSREQSLLRGGSPGHYMDFAPSGSGLLPESLRVVLLPNLPAPDAPFTHDCPVDGSACEVAVDQDGTCRKDFRWMNLRGTWGAPGGLFSGDTAPISPRYQNSWDPFAWLDLCDEPAPKGNVVLRAKAASTGTP